MPESDLSLLLEAARAAGKIATPFWRKNPKTWEKDAGAGPVTEADLAVDTMLKDRLLTARPTYGWLSEESEDDPDRLAKSHVFIIDPIDGTRAFIEGSRTWAHSLAVAVDGIIMSAAIYLPLHDKMYVATQGGGATLNGQPIQGSNTTQLDGATVLSAKLNFDPSHWSNGTPPMQRHFRSSLAYRMALVAEGRFDAMITFRDTWEWDVAAGTLIAAEAGAKVTDRNGLIPTFNSPHPALTGLLAANPKIHTELRDQLVEIKD